MYGIGMGLAQCVCLRRRILLGLHRTAKSAGNDVRFHSKCKGFFFWATSCRWDRKVLDSDYYFVFLYSYRDYRI